MTALVPIMFEYSNTACDGPVGTSSGDAAGSVEASRDSTARAAFHMSDATTSSAVSRPLKPAGSLFLKYAQSTSVAFYDDPPGTATRFHPADHSAFSDSSESAMA